MKTIHHATVKKAEKLGFLFETGENEYTIRWPERNRRITGTDAAQLVSDMSVLKTIVLEYPGVKVDQLADRFMLTAGDDEFEGMTLEDAWSALTDAEIDLDALEAAEDDEDADDDEGKSIIKKSYKRKYRPFKHRNGDEIGRLVSEHVLSGEKGDDGRPRIDAEKLKEFAVRNECWQDNYAFLNPGMQRMNVCNRLRARIRHGHEPIWS